MKKILTDILLLTIIALALISCNDGQEYLYAPIAPESKYESTQSYYIPMISLPELGENAHPFARRLFEILSENDRAAAYIVDIDGNGTAGMKVWDRVPHMPTLYHIHNGELVYEYLPTRRAGFWASFGENNRLIYQGMGNGEFDHRLYRLEEGVLVQDFSLWMAPDWTIDFLRLEDAVFLFGYLPSGGEHRYITYEEHKILFEQYGLKDLSFYGRGLPDDREIILVMTKK